jgi:hypothetical protein
MVSPDIMMQRNKPILAANVGLGKLFFTPSLCTPRCSINATQQLVYFGENAYNGFT